MNRWPKPEPQLASRRPCSGGGGTRGPISCGHIDPGSRPPVVPAPHHDAVSSLVLPPVRIDVSHDH